MDLSNVSTLELSEELEQREAVNSVNVAPHAEARITTDHGEQVIVGPAIIIVNQD